MWLGEQITERGIGNGISLVISIGIVARLPQAGQSLLDMFAPGGSIEEGRFNVFMASPCWLLIAVIAGSLP